MSEKIVDWEQLPVELLDLIIVKLDCISDVANFALVCTSWHSVYASTYKRFLCRNKLPMLLIPTQEKSTSKRSLFCVTENKTLGIQLNVPYNRRCSGSCHGWLAFSEDDMAVTLFNPVTGAAICLPPVMDAEDADNPVYDINKVILSADPSLHPDSCEVVVKYSYANRLAFMKIGQKEWTYSYEIDGADLNTSDMIYHEGKIYASDRKGKIISLDTDNMVMQLVVEEFANAAHSYLVNASGGDIMIVLRDLKKALTTTFEVYKLKSPSETTKQTTKQIERVNSLDGDAFFVGDNCSMSFLASHFPGCKPNCIYFSDDYHNMRSPYEYRSVCDMGIFDTVNENFVMHYSPNKSHVGMPPPVWFLPKFMKDLTPSEPVEPALFGSSFVSRFLPYVRQVTTIMTEKPIIKFILIGALGVAGLLVVTSKDHALFLSKESSKSRSEA